MALGANAILTWDVAAAFLKPPYADVPVVEAIIEGTSQLFNKMVGCTLRKTTYTAIKLDGPGTSRLYLPAWPVVSPLGAIIEDGVTLVLDTDFYADLPMGFLTKATYANTLYSEMYGGARLWTNLTQGITVTFTAGYDITATLPALPTMPADIKLACLKQCAYEYKKYMSKSWGQTSSSLGGQSTSFSEDDVLPFVGEVLRKYRRITL
jgi:hypothetical protein